MVVLLIAVPTVFGLLCLGLPVPRLRVAALVAGSWVHLGVVAASWWAPLPPVSAGFLGLDPLGHLFVTVISLLFAATALHFIGYQRTPMISQRIFLSCMLGLLAALSLVCVSQHLGLLWVALETSTLAATPLIYFHLGGRALEATWKFLLMNSVGIALALLGVFCTALATLTAGSSGSLALADLVAQAGRLDQTWLRAGFLLVLVGYGTKMGLAPLHSWLPDAHGEAPAPISALLSGAVLNAAFLAILRAWQICQAAGLASFAGGWLVALGLISMAVAGIFLVGQRHFKRLLAYSSVEHMGILAVAVGLGSAAAYPGMLHTVHNVLYKGALFFIAGLLGQIFGSYRIADIRGVGRSHPVAGVLLIAALCAILGLPPFGLFFSEVGIIFAAGQAGRWATLAGFVICLGVVFVGMLTAVLPMVFGDPPEPGGPADRVGPRERWRTATMATAAGLLLAVGLAISAYQPGPVRIALEQAAGQLAASQGAEGLVAAIAGEDRP